MEGDLGKKLNELFATMLKEVKPSLKEINDVNEYSNELMGRLKKVMPEDVEVILAGSVARGTQVRGKSDIDIFLLFPKYLEERTMEHKALELSKMVVDSKAGESYEINYAEHPYLKLLNPRRALTADIVPAFKITDASERASAVDRTQLHNFFILENLSEKQKDDVRVLKYLLQRHNIYGAESSKHAFSGYLCELLICHYGSLAKLLEAFSAIQMPAYINVLGKTACSGGSVSEDIRKRFNAPLIVIDPTDPNRNVAASVSAESFSRAVMISRRLLAKPTKSVIYGNKYSDEKAERTVKEFLDKYGLEINLMAFDLQKISEDTLWPQLEKLRQRLAKELEKDGFGLMMSFSRIEGNRGMIAIFSNELKMGSRKIIGPEVTIASASEKFYNAHKGVYNISVEGSRLVAIEKSGYASINAMLRHAVNGKDLVFPPDIKKSSANIYSSMPSSELTLMLYHGLVERMSI